MKLYVMRHGQTDWNVLGKIQGCTDIELNVTGVEQAKNAKQEFNKYDIDLILCSPLKRTRKTAEIINEDRKIPIIYDKRIMERGFGDFEGKYFREVESNFTDGMGNSFWDYHVNLTYKNVEPVVELCEKVWNFLDEVKEKYHDKSVLLVTHGGTAKVINSYFEGIDENGILPRVGIRKL